MLDAETRRRIDTARDVLVGKVPDPKSQVEQITIALIYKFMDDMDAQAEELGGQRTFFAGEFARYGWPKLARSGLGGHEMLGLYAEAITRMPENPGIPPLFRSIFSNAYLPYRDPETLRAFLRVIDEFTYDHSERLGDAFEYLLSVMGAQGDAGQFRTPRHIIDFIVSVVDPRKEETVLDPACGTAGFLISSYRHIRQANTDAGGHDALTPEERGRLASNFKGYDISPDMVRLSLVNMYLHGLAAPQIDEYDTLTSEEKWHEYADVILANPPFMSPKGGIRPHGRFSVPSRRSEVLFVDYIAEHLTAGGRAGVIVPEGVIFQSQRAHTQLRRMLVETALVAVVSLPAGVFQPYSGVKTSILILDKTLARRADGIAFFKAANDGYDLGAQRREIAANDLPTVRAELGEYLRRLRTGESLEDFAPTTGLVVAKERIAEGGDYNLSGERYRENGRQDSQFPYVRLDAVAKVMAGNSAPQGEEYFIDGEFPFIRTADVGAVHRSDNFAGTKDKVNQRAVDEKRLRLFPASTILFPKSGASTFLNHRVVTGEPAYVSSHLAGIICDEQKAMPKYVYHLLCQVDARDITPDQAYPSLRLTEIGAIEIPLPPLEVQREIVSEIEGYQRVIDGARAVVENWRPRIAVDAEWPLVKVGEVFKRSTDTIMPSEMEGPVTYVGLENISQHTGHVVGNTVTEDPTTIKSLKNEFERGDILYGKLRPNLNKVWLSDRSGICSTDIYVMRPKQDGIVPELYAHIFRGRIFNDAVVSQVKGAQLPRAGWSAIARLEIPLPPLETQRAIVSELEAERGLVSASAELVGRMEGRIAEAVGRVWGGE